MELARRTSACMPHTTAVSPSLTTALPTQWVRELVVQERARKAEGVRPFGRMGGMVGSGGDRWAVK